MRGHKAYIEVGLFIREMTRGCIRDAFLGQNTQDLAGEGEGEM